MRIALLADIHGNFAAMQAVLADLRHRGVDRIVALGDHLSGPLLPSETASLMMREPWVAVAGNHERQLLSFDATSAGPSDRYAHAQLSAEHFAWLRSLQPTARVDGDMLLCHGTPGSDTAYLLDTVENGRLRLATTTEIEARLHGVSATVVAGGHSHVPRVVKTGRGQLLINPGSVGLPAYADESPSHHVAETGSPDARYAILERQPSGWTTGLFSVPYDFEAMAGLADRNHRPDWSHALRTGYALS